MPPARDEPPLSADPALARRLRLAQAAILWERLWPRLAPALGVAGLFLVLALFDVWALVPGWLHVAGLVLFAVLFAVLLAVGLAGLDLPDRRAALRRIELASGVPHRPLTALEDRLASEAADPGTETLWRLHRRRMAAAARRFRVGWPRAGLAALDPWGLRAVLGLLLVIGLTTAGDRWPGRILAAVTPDLSGAPSSPPELDLWIGPPAHTGLAPMFLAGARAVPRAEAAGRGRGPDLVVPAGSTLLARVHGGRGVPELRVDGTVTRFRSIDADNHELRTTIEGGPDRRRQTLVIAQNGETLGSWPIAVVPDAAPTIEFTRPPGGTERLALRLDYEAEDDYGLRRVGARLRLKASGEEMELALPLPGIGVRRAAETGYLDLTAHPWAGVEVGVRLVAEDAVGQVGLSDEVDVVLPQRIFRHPVARVIVEQRRILTIDPARRKSVAETLEALTAVPQRYGDDVVVHLGLRSAAGRLRWDKDEKAIAEVQELLWDLALRIEDGALSLAERELRELQRTLMEALSRGAGDDEIERLMSRLEEALDRYLRALADRARELARQGAEPDPLGPDDRIIEGDELRRLLDRARELSRSGAREAARELLAQLRNLLENLKTDALVGGSSPERRQAEQALRELGDLMGRQQDLLDRTFRSSRQGREGEPGRDARRGADADGLATRQEALRRALGDIMRRLGEGAGEIPAPLGRAERAMRDARRALETGRPGAAVGPQTRALDQLREGARAMADEMMRRFGRGRPGGGGSAAGADDVDPLGRPLPGAWDRGDRVKIPDEAEVQRARRIIEELRRRAGERRRPALERDYIERLLKRF